MTSRSRGSHRGTPTLRDARGPRGVPSLPHPDEEANLALVTGTILEDPTRDTSRGGEPVTIVLLGIKASDVGAEDQTACVEVEAGDPVADPHRNMLRKGRRLVVLGRLTGVGVWATALVPAVSMPPGYGGAVRP